MRKLALVVALVLMVAPARYAASWTGWIVDEHCGAKDANADKASCTKTCVKDHGAKLVFYNSADKQIYKLDNQELAMKHIGHEVTVSGEAADGAIKVSGIEESKPASK